MEKLQPILKQKYWICFGLSVVFVLFGWWNASGDLSARTAERKTSVEGSFGKAGQGASDPNESWVAGGKKENEEDKGSYKTASLQLWKRQQTAREWPEQIRGEMNEITYFLDVPKETRERWASIYRTQIEDLLKIVQPFKNDTGEGLVVVDANRITRQPYESWQKNRPTSNEIWSNQEDIWLLKALLTSISKANDSATRITESQVREIKRLHLRGGDRKTKPGAVGGKSGGLMSGGMGAMGSMGAMGAMGGGEDAMYSGGMGGGGTGGGISTSHPGTSFEGKSGGDVLTEEFGAGAGAAGMSGMGGMGMPGGEGFGGPMSGGPGLGGGKAAAKKEVRYVDDAEKDQGYKTRAFLLDVVVRDERLPDLLAKLTNSDFPVEIVRVEILSRAGGASSGMGGEGMSGYGGGSGGYGGGMPGGMGESSGMGGYPGGAGLMSSGSSGGYGDLAGGGGLGGYGVGAEGGYPGDTGMMESGTGFGAGAMKGVEVVNAAMADPLLIEVRIGGLLTLYMTPEEALNQEKTEEKSAEEEAAAAPATSGTSETSATDGTTTISTPVSDDTPEGTVLATPADGSTPLPDNDTTPSGAAAPTTAPLGNGSAVPGGTPAEPATGNPETGSSSSEPSNSSAPPESKAP